MRFWHIDTPTAVRSWPFAIAAACAFTLAVALWFSWPTAAPGEHSGGNQRAIYWAVALLLVGVLGSLAVRLAVAQRRRAWEAVTAWGLPSNSDHVSKPAPMSPAFRSLHMLGLSSPVTVEDVKRAYRVRAAQMHPDSGGDKQAFRELQCAYREALRYAELCAGLSRPASMGNLKLNLPRDFPTTRGWLALIVSALALIGVGGALSNSLPRDLIVVLIWLMGMPTLGTFLTLMIAEARPGVAFTVSVLVITAWFGIWTAILGRFSSWFRNVFTPDTGDKLAFWDVEIGWLALGYATLCCLIALLMGWAMLWSRRASGWGH